MNAAYRDIQIDQGASFEFPFTLYDNDNNPISLSGATIEGKIRSAPESTTVIATFVGTVVSGSGGQGKITLSSTVTAALSVDNSGAGKRVLTKRVYDVEVTYSDGFKQRILEGIAFISPECTK